MKIKKEKSYASKKLSKKRRKRIMTILISGRES
jgi:hypothetical protein